MAYQRLSKTVVFVCQNISKYILIYLKNDYVMIAHLGMSGKFLIKNKRDVIVVFSIT